MKKSRYVIKVKNRENGYNILYNIRNGLKLKYSIQIDVWKNEKIQPYLIKNNFLIDNHQNESEEVLQEYNDYRKKGLLHLIILPHENCNFRCVYCYERFEKNKMNREVEQGIINYIQRQLESGEYHAVSISWFGGEPLLGLDVMERLSQDILGLCEKYNVKYITGITTNGYLLTPQVFSRLCDIRVKNFQITIDGIKEIHDKQRIMVNGQGTYDRIMENLISMKDTEEDFKVLVRMNVTPENIKHMSEHLNELKERFLMDPRFELYFHNVGHWGGENDENVEICEENVMLDLLEKATIKGMNTFNVGSFIAPNGSVCYASNPHSFVIGTDGTLYKCTVALYEDFNHVGKLLPDGNMELNEQLMDMWTNSGINDSTCKQCFFAPGCHGDRCPLIRFQEKVRPCPDWKSSLSNVINLMELQDRKHDMDNLNG